MLSSVSGASTPFVSVVLPTRDRPRLLPVALACYRHQTYPQRELIVVDDGTADLADADAVTAAGGRLIRVDPGTPLGTKLNRGVQEARGPLCQKMDDDDWYAPRFLERLVSRLLADSPVVCRPTFALLRPYLLFDVARWELRRSEAAAAAGGTLLFARDDWTQRPFRALSRQEDMWYVLDQVNLGVAPVWVQAQDLFLAVRHAGDGRDLGHTWTRQAQGQSVEAYFRQRPLYKGGPEALLPEWALAVYRDLQRDLLGLAPAVDQLIP